MKSYTDLEQSRKLAGILPIETADMDWSMLTSTPTLLALQWTKTTKKLPNIPAWSLSKLCELIEVEYKIEKSYLDQSGICTYSFIFEGLSDGQPGYYRTYEQEEIIDAAVEFIEFLKRNGLL